MKVLLPFNAAIVINSARHFKKKRRIELSLVAAPLAGHSAPVTIHQLHALNERYNGELDISAKQSPTELRLFIQQKVTVQSCASVRSAVQKLADSVREYVGLTAFTQV